MRPGTAIHPAADIRETLVRAAALQAAGQAGEAEQAYREVLEKAPDDAEALHGLGLIHAQSGRPEPALRHIEQAIARCGERADFHNSLGVVLSGMERLDAAADAFRTALELRPDYLAARCNLALALHRGGQLQDAVLHYRRVLDARPGDVAARNNLGCALRDLHRPAEAAAQFRQALAGDPAYEPARHNLTALEMDQPLAAAGVAQAASRLWFGRAPAATQPAAGFGADRSASAAFTSAPAGAGQDPSRKTQPPPIIITAPSERNGVTLLQRLLNSTRQIIVYGEDGVLFSIMPRLFFDRMNLHVQHGAQGEAVRRRFLEESTEFWSSNLWPDTQEYAKVLGECFEHLAAMYGESSRRLGFECWGLKHPLTEIGELSRLRQLLPAAKIIFIYRNLYDVARSAKARRFARGPEQIAELARRWQTNLLAVLAEPPPGTMVLRYEELTVRPDEHIEKIEAFTGISGIDRSVLQRRFNTFAGDRERGYSPSEYIEPEPLTPEEEAALRGAAEEALAKTGYLDSEPRRPSEKRPRDKTRKKKRPPS